MNNNKDVEIIEYKRPETYKFGFFITIFTIFLSVIFYYYYKEQLMELNVDLILSMQNPVLAIVIKIISEAVFYSIIFFLIIILTLSKNGEEAFSMLFGIALLIYVTGFFKLIFRDFRPVLLDKRLGEDNCACDYGLPSGYSAITTGFLMFIYHFICSNNNVKWFVKFFMQFGIFLCIVFFAFSRLYYGFNTITQSIIGIQLGFLAFFTERYFQDGINKKIIWPIFYKERFQSQNVIFFILSLMIYMNYALFFLWGLNYTIFETAPNFNKVENCLECITDENIMKNFSGNILQNTLFFNMFFGLLFGIYLSDIKIFKFEGLLKDKNLVKYFLRVFLLLGYLSLLILIFYPIINVPFLPFIRSLGIPLLVGFLLTSSYLENVNMFIGFDKKIDDEDDDYEVENNIDTYLESKNYTESSIGDIKTESVSENVDGGIDFD